MLRLGILGSTRGTALLPIIDAIQQKQLAAEIAIVLSNKRDALILEKAKQHGLMAEFIDSTSLTRELYDQKLSDRFKAVRVEFVVLIGYMRILSRDFIHHWQNKIINIHPSLLPEFSGLMDLKVHQAVLDAKRTISGCTVHYVTEEVDQGPILLQKTCAVLPGDSAFDLKSRVQSLESIALIEAINKAAIPR